MTRLLVSVRSLEEALDAYDAGADLIDLKEPAAGPLGCVPPSVAVEVAARLGGRAPLSMALGELRNAAARYANECSFDQRNASVGGVAVQEPAQEALDFTLIPATIAFAKLGLAGCAAVADWPAHWTKAVGRLPASCAPVAVIYADWHAANAPSPTAVMATAAEIGCRALLIDTFSKDAGGLFEHLQPSQLSELLTKARLQNLVTVLAGSLTLNTAADALQLQPDYLA
ncbi:MAG TPA: (5-formylfuran-3-yl)methyl phosphate synthase, partial [Pirellulales bacterium]|nr:(5-formylfuran-3-yl)methyl phosphate synthase [Pirellulales bacterium]